MTKKDKIKNEAITSLDKSYIRKDLKKFLFLTGALIIIMIGLSIIDRQSGILAKLSHSLMTKLVGQ